MAQWNGQYTGNTHQTKVVDLVKMFKNSIAAFRNADSDVELKSKKKNLFKLAEKLLNARLKLLNAKLYDVNPVIEDKVEIQSSHLENLRRQLEKVESEGVNGIFVEFGVEKLIIA